MFNLFNKKSKKATNSKIETLNKKHISKIIGGDGGESTDITLVKSKSNIKTN